LPASCEPANEFLYHFSATFHTCVPTNLAFISSCLGTFSIVAWLFAQLPQIYKNHQLQSTSGLSILFLAEWLLGDVSNLLGSLFTRQALWQVIIAGYYVSVDCALVGQWIWYELLKHGRPLRPAWSRIGSASTYGGDGGAGMQEVYDGVTIDSGSAPTSPKSPPLNNKIQSPFDNQSLPPNSPGRRSTPNRTIHRLQNSSSPMPSPKTILYISLIIAVLSNTGAAKPVSPFAPAPYSTHTLTTPSSSSSSSPHTLSATESAGKIISWLSTFLYLGSRIPQLYKNHIRKSTAGLSPTLFLAAFCGNFFYSSSLLTNPCAWFTFAPGEGKGWVGPEGSVQGDWILRATPFFLGAAGVLIMDAAVGCQFWYFGDGGERGRPEARGGDEIVVVVVNDEGVRRKRRWRWHRVSGWMRGWVPS
ncbi:PQ loop repeat-domain-containing protein, partial [Clohesyomyces aquaticus]